MSQKLAYTRPPLYPYQKRIIDSKARYTVCEAATKIGKTSSHLIWLFEQALTLKENQSVWWVAPVYTQAEMAFRRLKTFVSDKTFFKVNESKLTLTLPTGSIIVFKSAEKPDNLYGDDVYACVFDEFTRAREDAWFALRSTVTKTNGKIKFIGNVKSKGNWGYNLAQTAKQGGEFEYFKVTAYDAIDCGLLQADEIEQARRELPFHVFQTLYLAEPAEDGTNPFGLDYIRKNIKPISNQQAVCYGIDLGKSVDYTVIIGLDGDGNVCYFDRFQQNWPIVKDRIKSLGSKIPICIDSTGVGDPIVDDIKYDTNLKPFKFTSTTKQQLMEGLCAAIQNSEISYPEGVIVDELIDFEYEYTRTGVKYSAPAGHHDDCVCALALGRSIWTKSSRVGNYSIYIV